MSVSYIEFKIISNIIIKMDSPRIMCHTCNCNIDDGNHICERDDIDDIIEDDSSTEELHKNSSTENKDTDLTERLISEVFIREPLWNSKLPYKHRGPANIKLLWNEVDTCLGIVPGTSQIKWKSLRDRFVKEHNRQNEYIASGSGAKAKKDNTWYLYKPLNFLLPTIAYRKTKSNLENINPNRPSISLIEKSNFLSTSTQAEEISVSKQNILKSQLNENKKRCISESENIQSLKPTKHIKKSNTLDNHLEDALLKELQLTRPTKEQCESKPDKIETFAKYMETCLREMPPEVSKRVIKKCLMILIEEDE